MRKIAWKQKAKPKAILNEWMIQCTYCDRYFVQSLSEWFILTKTNLIQNINIKYIEQILMVFYTNRHFISISGRRFRYPFRKKNEKYRIVNCLIDSFWWIACQKTEHINWNVWFNQSFGSKLVLIMQQTIRKTANIITYANQIYTEKKQPKSHIII